MKQIAEIFGLKDRTTIVRSNQKINEFVNSPNKIKRIVSKGKTRFFYFYYRYNQIFNEK